MWLDFFLRYEMHLIFLKYFLFDLTYSFTNLAVTIDIFLVLSFNNLRFSGLHNIFRWIHLLIFWNIFKVFLIKFTINMCNILWAWHIKKLLWSQTFSFWWIYIAYNIWRLSVPSFKWENSFIIKTIYYNVFQGIFHFFGYLFYSFYFIFFFIHI